VTYRILIGDVITNLREMPDNSVHCVVTSPPYWGLRDYGIEPSVWGGEADCDHRFEFGAPTSETNYTDKRRWQHTRNGRDEEQPVEKRVGWKRETIEHGQFCRCGAWLGCLGLEPTPALFVEHMVLVFQEVRRVLRKDGTCWMNMGDSYSSQPNQRVQKGEGRDDVAGWKQASNTGSCGVGSRSAEGLKPKDLVGMPWRLAFALQDDGWWLRQDIIWSKPNPMPESVTDRCTKAHEYIFLLTKSAKYYYDAEAVKETVTGGSHARGDGVNPKAEGKNSRFNVSRDHGHVTRPKQNSSYSAAINELVSTRNKRSVWEIATEPFPEAHFATFPTKLVEPCILAGTSEKGCCATCGTPWWRKTVRVDTGRTQKMADGWDTGDGRHGTVHRDGREAGESGVAITVAETVGWLPGCLCESAYAPCTVLDPFSGSGTTGLVALANRCNYIGIELSPKYAAMSERRLSAAAAQGILL
jgi:DNA modification methylase